MVKHTFCHLPGIGLRTERLLWDSGVHGWDDFDNLRTAPSPLGHTRLARLRKHLDQSKSHLHKRNPHYFADLLASDQHWRLFPDFRAELVYLDIETTGMGTPDDHITTIALYDGGNISWYVQGDNLDQFPAHIRDYRVVVTYNGKCFDLPFIRNTLRARMDQVHIDLRYVLWSLGYRGGLKGCEHQLGIEREELEGVDGFFAVLLWNEYRRKGNSKALETLLAYNILDTVNLERLMVMAYNLKIAGTPFEESLRLPLPKPPQGPFTPDRTTIEGIRTRMEGRSNHQGS